MNIDIIAIDIIIIKRDTVQKILIKIFGIVSFMVTSHNPIQTLLSYLNNNTIATIEELKNILNTQSKMTVFRWLRKTNYISSCSHRGKYYSLKQFAKYNQYGLWMYKTVVFSEHGTLKTTLEILIRESEKGYNASELNRVQFVS